MFRHIYLNELKETGANAPIFIKNSDVNFLYNLKTA
ncbi:hypothetical protein SAMN05880573_13912 [Chryseobacterium sp. RU33C]|nr:hypothetical protein SAMN05880573_13912 [Chryseobacterium sp. RU33C]